MITDKVPCCTLRIRRLLVIFIIFLFIIFWRVLSDSSTVASPRLSHRYDISWCHVTGGIHQTYGEHPAASAMHYPYIHALLLIAILAAGVMAGKVGNDNGSFPSELNYTATFRDELSGRDSYSAFHTMGLAWDGSRYISVSGGSTVGLRLAVYSRNGTITRFLAPIMDFRSVFATSKCCVGDTDTNSHARPKPRVYVRLFANNTLYRMSCDGVFRPAVDLNGTLESQSHVVCSSCGGGNFVAMSYGGRVDFWNRRGRLVRTMWLEGYGDILGENQYPAYTNIAALDQYLLTLANGELSVWNCSGQRVARVQLLGVSGAYDIYWSMSVANGLLWLQDESTLMFRGYRLCRITDRICQARKGSNNVYCLCVYSRRLSSAARDPDFSSADCLISHQGRSQHRRLHIPYYSRAGNG